MDKLQGNIEKYINTKKDWKSNVIGQCKSWLNDGLKPRAMTRDLDWGVSVPVKDADGKVLYVWFDAPIGYITATKELDADNWEKYWKDEETSLVHFIGKDNIVFHTIIFPMMLMEHGDYILPENVPANEFMNLEGEKISTSRNWAVWLHEYLKDFPDMQDELRYCLITNLPESKDSDFSWKDFQQKNNNELVAILGNYINRVFVLCDKFFDKKVPHLSNNDVDKEIFSDLKELKEKIEKSTQNFKFREAMSYVIDVARLGNKYLTDTEPWKIFKDDPDRVKDIIHNSIQIVGNISILCEPFLPFTSNKIKGHLNVSDLNWNNIGSEILNFDHVISGKAHIFSKIEDQTIEDQIKKLKLNNENDNNINNDLEKGVLLDTKPKTKKPSMYNVLLLNDDYTPMEFVVLVLENVFNKKQEEATQIMLHVHKNGVGVCGTFTYEVAEAKCKSVMDLAKKHEHPLQCTMEKN
mgnify:CR=1 FL=1